MRRLLTAIVACLVLLGLIVPAAAVSGASAAKVPKVVIVVGPSGVATDRYRSEARSAAALARHYTPDVTELYSPNATWPAVKKALQGASVVIYMGHGNGWPSRYRNNLFPPSQNGFGLNPSAGSGDYSHQYFGEGPIAANIRLAPNAIVLLNHLCYASGNSEPGLPEGTLDQARQRVDNFAAGFIKAGASAVVAEAYSSPNYLLRSVLSGNRSIEAAWRGAPSHNGHTFAFDSRRSRGYVAEMDPERGTSGFSRSIVLRTGLASADVRRGALGSPSAVRAPDALALPVVPSLVTTGMTLKMPAISTATLAGSKVTFKVPYTIKHRDQLPKTIQASVRWDPLDPVVATDPATEVAPDGAAPASDPAAGTASPAPTSSAAPTGHAAPAANAAPGADPAPAASTDPSAGVDPATAAAEDAPTEPPSLDLVTPERVGDVVAPAKFKITKKSLSIGLAAPSTPGRYRLTVTLHDKDGVEYDAATQAMIPGLIVRVTGALDAEIVAPASIKLAPGGSTTLKLWAANLGKAPWGHPAVRDPKDPDPTDPASAARVSGQWVALGGLDHPDQSASASAASATPVTLPAGLKPGVVVPVALELFAPSKPGEYLLVLDILTPDHGSIVADGVEPTIIRVTVAVPVIDTTPAPTDAPADPTATPADTTKAPDAAPVKAGPARTSGKHTTG